MAGREGRSPENHWNAPEHSEGEAAGVVWDGEWHGLPGEQSGQKSKRNAEREKIKEEEEMLAGQALQMLWIQLITSSAVEGDLALWALMTFVFVWYVQV